MSILDEINNYSLNLSKAVKWHNSGELISEVVTSNTQGQKSDFIYEFNCYIKIVIDLKVNNKVEFIIGSDTKYSFPKKPANKSGKPYFIVKNKSNIFQLCAGTKIETEYKTKRAPDISFQYELSSENPTQKDVFMIYDAKFTNRKNGKISYNQFSYIATMIKDLGLDKKIESKIIFDKLNDLDTNCILTNGKGLNKIKKYHESHNLKVVENFNSNNNNFNVIG